MMAAIRKNPRIPNQRLRTRDYNDLQDLSANALTTVERAIADASQLRTSQSQAAKGASRPSHFSQSLHYATK